MFGIFVILNDIIKLAPNTLISTDTHGTGRLIYNFLFASSNNKKFLELLLQPNQSQPQIKVCKLPNFNLTGHINIEPYKECRLKNDWGYLKNNRWSFNRNVLYKFRNIRCKYRNLTRINDFDIIYSPYALLYDNQPILAEVIEVFCLADNNRFRYDALHVQIVDRFLDPEFSAQHQQLKPPETCKPMNILLLSYDSLSRVSWFKRLPKTTRFILGILFLFL